MAFSFISSAVPKDIVGRGQNEGELIQLICLKEPQGSAICVPRI